MKPRSPKRRTIAVEVRPEPVEHVTALAARLLELDPNRFERAVALIEGYVSIYDRPDEPEWAWKARAITAARGLGEPN